jgi:magnesium chelatase subunit I
MNKPIAQNLGDLKKQGYTSKSLKEELRSNLISALQQGTQIFDGILGYNETVIPELQTAILAGHHINFLGLRGQAKTSMARKMIHLLDEWMPIIKGSEINDDPFKPLSRFGIDLLAEMGDETPIDWVHRSDRYIEKLATPDVTVADLIGDIDPIKAANLRVGYQDERAIHFGLIPRSNRCIFVINELPDLQPRIQVALFNILQEGDIQIRGFKLRLPLDVQFVFTANPEDYTNRGSIVTPLKDRIGSQILTHYPADVALAATISAQEAKLTEEQKKCIHIPQSMKMMMENIAFIARESEFVDQKVGFPPGWVLQFWKA